MKHTNILQALYAYSVGFQLWVIKFKTHHQPPFVAEINCFVIDSSTYTAVLTLEASGYTKQCSVVKYIKQQFCNNPLIKEWTWPRRKLDVFLSIEQFSTASHLHFMMQH